MTELHRATKPVRSAGSIALAWETSVALARRKGKFFPGQIRARRAPPRHELASASSAPAAALSLESLTLSFGGIVALAGIDLSVDRGQILAVIGPNGAGKSSLINVISGLYKPDSGRVWLDGRSFTSVPTERLAHLGIARTFQNIALFKGLSVFDNMAVGAVSSVRSNSIDQMLGVGRARQEREATRARVEDVLAFLDLGAVRGRMAGSLPYGLQKRVELGRALVIQPRLLLLDEPMAGMTASEKREMSEFVRETRRRYGTTIILIEHDIGIVMELSDRVAVLDYGRKIADALPSAVINDSAVIDAYLGVAHELDQGKGI
jgi:branched-chain amino acid transport system ATP-binding protein